MTNEARQHLRVVPMPVPKPDSCSDDCTTPISPADESVIEAILPRLVPIIAEACRNQEPAEETWIQTMLSPKNIISLVALTFSVGGAFALWSRAIVNEDKLNENIRPILQALETNTKSIQGIQASVAALVSFDRRQQEVSRARNALIKFNSDYQRRVDTWVRNKRLPYPDKSADHIKAEIELDNLLRTESP